MSHKPPGMSIFGLPVALQDRDGMLDIVELEVPVALPPGLWPSASKAEEKRVKQYPHSFVDLGSA